MSPFFRTFARTALVLGLGLGAWPADGQSAKPKLRPPSEVMEPGASGRSTTNSLEPVAARKTPGQPLEQDFKKPFNLFRSDNIFDGPMPLPTRPAAPSATQSKKAKADADRKRNWVFSTEEEMMGVRTPEEMLGVVEYGPDGQLKTKKSALERYYERMGKNQAGPTNQPSAEPLTGEVRPSDREDKPAFAAIAKPGTVSIFDSPNPDSRRAGGLVNVGSPLTDLPNTPEKRLSEIFGSTGPEGAGQLPEKNRGQELRTQEFKQLLESNPAVAPVTAFGAGGFSPAPPSALNSFSSGNFGRETFGSPPAITSFPQGLSSFAPLPVAPAFQPSLTPSPALNTVRPWTPPPSFELPKRKF